MRFGLNGKGMEWNMVHDSRILSSKLLSSSSLEDSTCSGVLTTFLFFGSRVEHFGGLVGATRSGAGCFAGIEVTDGAGG